MSRPDAVVLGNDYYSVRDVFEIYDNNILLRLIIILLLFSYISNTLLTPMIFLLNAYSASSFIDLTLRHGWSV